MRFFLYVWMMFGCLQLAYAEAHFLTISDFHYGASHSSDGYDTDDKLLNLSLQKYSQLSKNVDFIITLGDFPSHSFGYDSNKEKYIETVFHGLYTANTSKKPIFYVTGNNDSLRGNYQPFMWRDKSAISVAKDWESACTHCEGLTIDKTHMADAGYYSSYVIPGNNSIMLIVLNSIQFAETPFYIPGYPHQDNEAITQLKWFEKQLQSHQSKQLLIAMHVPPGSSYLNKGLWKYPYLSKFLTILTHYSSQYGEITLLTAHTHMDDIRKIRMNDGKNIYAYATPSISRLHHNNPGMKIFDLNSNMQIKNYTTYFTSKDDQWSNEQYQAISPGDSIFPQCRSSNYLANCLDSFSDDSVCQQLSKGLFYGVKSPRVDSSVCRFTYPINKLSL